MNLDRLQDKRARFLIQWVPAVLAFIVTIYAAQSTFGILVAILVSIIVLLLGLLIFYSILQRTSAPVKQSLPGNPAVTTVEKRVPCDPGPYRVDAGDDKIIKLQVEKGDLIKGHIRELGTQSFEWYIAEEKSMIFYKRREWRKFKPEGEGHDEPGYTLSLVIPAPARWFLILDNHGKQLDRTILVDFEPIS